MVVPDTITLVDDAVIAPPLIMLHTEIDVDTLVEYPPAEDNTAQEILVEPYVDKPNTFNT